MCEPYPPPQEDSHDPSLTCMRFGIGFHMLCIHIDHGHADWKGIFPKGSKTRGVGSLRTDLVTKTPSAWIMMWPSFGKAFPTHVFFLAGARCLSAGHHLRLTRGPAGNRTTTGSLSASTRTTPYQLSRGDTCKAFPTQMPFVQRGAAFVLVLM